MGIVDRITGRAKLAEVEQSLNQERAQSSFLEEGLRDLEDQVMGDEGWRRMGMEMEREFTRSGLDEIMKVSRAMYLSHPLIQRAVNVTTYYTWGQGWNWDAEDDTVSDYLSEFVKAKRNQGELFGQQAQLLTDVDLLVDGSIFQPVFYPTDEVAPQVRSIPADEIRYIYRDENDGAVITYYLRQWSHVDVAGETAGAVTQKAALYPDIDYRPTVRPARIRTAHGDLDVRWDSPIMMQKAGGLKHMDFGIPTTYAAMEWARAYKKFLEDWHTIVSSLARFAWKTTSKGTRTKRIKEKLSRRPGGRAGENVEERSADAGLPAGNLAALPKDMDLTPINKTGTTTSADDAKASRLMVGAAMDLPDTILSGDPQQGNLATAKSLDRPTELGFTTRQGIHADHRERLFQHAIDRGIRRGELPAGVKRDLEVTFPSVVEHDTTDVVNAIVSAATLDGKADAGTVPREELAKLLMNAIGVENVEQAIADLEAEDRTALEQATSQLAQAMEALRNA